MISFFTIDARRAALLAAAVLVGGGALAAQQAGTGPYRVVQRARLVEKAAGTICTPTRLAGGCTSRAAARHA